MNKPAHRYKIWQLNGDGYGERDAAPAPRRQVEDLVALMALYDYRPLLETKLQGTCSLPGGGTAKCKTKSISSESVKLTYEAAGGAAKSSEEMQAGARVQLNLDEIGNFRGVVATKKAQELEVRVDDDCKPLLRNKLSRLVAEHAVNLHEGKGSTGALGKIEPAIKSCNFIDHTGTIRHGVIVTLTRTDALVKARIVPPVRARITFRGAQRQMAEVTRNFEMGFAAKFCTAIPAADFSPSLKFTDD